MTDKTLAWGPTARTLKPHAFEAGADYPWCKHCGSVGDAYAHASDEERLTFDLAHSPEAEHSARELGRERDWFGYLTTANYQAVAERIRRMLAGKRYTWVDADAMGGYRPRVRTRQEMESVTAKLLTGENLTRPYAHITVSDTYGVWGIDSGEASQSEAHAAEPKRRTYLHFTRDRYGERLEIEHYAISGNHLWWVVAAESS